MAKKIKVAPPVPEALAEKMRTYQAKRLELDALETEIREAVMALEQTVVVENVRATFSKGRGKYDYEKAATPHKPPFNVIEQCSSLKTDWRAVCEKLELPKEELEAVYEEGKPSVKVKLVI
jgi:hypothetical protein